mgnify:FL=1|jgi:hypothetical protein
MNTEEMLKKEATRLRMAKLRAKRKPPKLANVHHTVKSLPDDNTLSYASVKKWISTQESIVKTARITERSIKSEVSQKDKDQAMRTRLGAQSYIRAIKQYITTGDWSSMYYGEFEDKLMQWTTVAAVGK